MNRTIIIGSRGSDLALWQANYVLSQLKQSGYKAEIKIIKTQGDKQQHLSFDKMEGKGFFTKEIENALLGKSIDLAIHSHKDLETNPPEGLCIAAVSEREDPSELLLIRKEAVDISLPLCLKKNAVTGTSSARRKSQLLAYRKDLQIKDLRGNVPTRVQKLRDKAFDAILLAYAGVKRLELDLQEFHAIKLSPKEFIPAQSQGVLAYQTREDDKELREALKSLNTAEVQERVAVERAVLNRLDGGCLLPLGIYCEKKDETYHAWASFSKDWKNFPKRIHLTSSQTDGFARQITEKLIRTSRKSVFITRDLTPEDFLYRGLTENGYQVHGQSLITLTAVPFSEIPVTDWIFFTSKNAVSFFFDQQLEIPDQVKLGVCGKGTEKMLGQYGKQADFTGEGGDTGNIGKAFAKKAEGKTVLFPISNRSLRSVQKELKKEQVREIIVYETCQKQVEKIPEAEILVFTSPSNISSFFAQEVLKEGQEIIAIGKSTGAALKSKGIDHYILPCGPEDYSLLDEIFAL